MQLLIILTLAYVGVLVSALAIGLILIARGLWIADRNLAAIAAGLKVVEQNTGPLGGGLTQVGQALSKTAEGLQTVRDQLETADGTLGSIAGRLGA